MGRLRQYSYLVFKALLFRIVVQLSDKSGFYIAEKTQVFNYQIALVGFYIC